MDRLLLLISFFVVSVAANHATSPAQTYWSKVLPTTPMPSAIKDLLASDVHVHNMAVTASVAVVRIPVVDVNIFKGYVNANQIDTKGSSPRQKYCTLLEEHLQSGTTIVKQFTRTITAANFIPRQLANSIPFSSTKLPEILAHFSISPTSIEAETMKDTLQQCEDPATDGESKYCATSLESMVDFSTSTLKSRDVEVVSTTVSKEGEPKQQYIIASNGVQKLSGSNFVVCHAKNYPYAVFYCHEVKGFRVYKVSMAAAKDGTKVEAATVCHSITAGSVPNAYLKALNVQTGETVNICHFLPQDHLVWSPKK